ncbi:MAG: site-specific integrase [Actinomycetia bacterium]|nr:site-specific integrase [Actinomycetes bacterium]
MASIVKKTKNKGLAYYVVYRLDGKQYWKLAGSRRKDAEKLKSQIEHDIHTGTHQELPEITFRELANKWLDIKRTQVRPKTFASYKPHVSRLIDQFGPYKAKRITQEMVERFAAELSEQTVLAPATASRILTLLGGIFRKGQQWSYVGRNPAEHVSKPKLVKPEVEFLLPDEIKRLMKATDQRHRCLIMFACLTGCRQSEILGLRWSDIDLEAGMVNIRQVLQGGSFFEPKTPKSKRTIVIPPILVQELKVHKTRQAVELDANECDLVFTNQLGRPMHSRNLTQRVLEPTLRRAGLRRVGFHALRHSYVSLLINQGENVRFIQEQVGHSSATVTWDIYSHLFPENKKEAVLRLQNSLFKREDELQTKVF